MSLRTPPNPTTHCPVTGKRCYGSEKAARQACATMHARVVAYRCPHCNRVHVANAGKRGHE